MKNIIPLDMKFEVNFMTQEKFSSYLYKNSYGAWWKYGFCQCSHFYFQVFQQLNDLVMKMYFIQNGYKYEMFLGKIIIHQQSHKFCILNDSKCYEKNKYHNFWCNQTMKAWVKLQNQQNVCSVNEKKGNKRRYHCLKLLHFGITAS